MKKLIILLFSALSLTAFAQEKKTIFIQTPQCENTMIASMVSKNLISAFAGSDEWQPVDIPLEKLMAFESNAQLPKYMFMLITTIYDMGGDYHISCRILDMETAATINMAMETAGSSPVDIQNAANSIAKKLLQK